MCHFRVEEKASSGFNKFHEKKAKQLADKKTGTLRKISSLISKQTNSIRRHDIVQDNLFDNPELEKVDEEYEKIFSTLEEAVVNDVKHQVNLTTSLCMAANDKSIDELSEIIQNSYKVLVIDTLSLLSG